MHARRFNPILLITILLGFGLTQGSMISAKANGNVQVIPQVDYTFGKEITFRASVQSEIPVEQAMVFLQAGDQQQIDIGNAVVSGENLLLLVYDLDQHPIPAFSQVTYWFDLVLQDGTQYESHRFTFDYLDNRFNWQDQETGIFRVHWYEGDIGFVQDVINVAQAGLLRAQDFLPISPQNTVDIYIYNNDLRLQETLLLPDQEWVAGHAALDLGMILVSLTPGPDQHLEMERQIPHELMHVWLYQYLGRGYKNLPIWLVEGLASINELYPNPDYQILLNNAYEKGNLLKLDSLCEVFPREASGFLLGYAESASFTGYLYQEFGSGGLDSLVKEYTTGVNCERGIELALGEKLDKLERSWREDVFGENIYISAVKGFLPWIVILFVALVPLVLTVFIK